MTAATARTEPVAGDRRAEDPLLVLARIEAMRFARHPLFLVGVVLLAWSTSAIVNDGSSDTLTNGVFATFFVGVFGCIVAYRLTRSTETSAEAMDAVPASLPRRTAALCLACLVPGAVGLVWSVAMLVGLQVWPLAEWQLAGFSSVDVTVILVGHVLVACVGGPLLGVAAGRWLRFPGAGVLVALVLVVTMMLSMGGRAAESSDATWSTGLRLLSPYAFFSESSVATVGHLDWVMRWPGSPFAYLAYQVTLCGLAVVAAMAYGARGAARARLRLWGLALVTAAAISFLLAVLAGPATSFVHWEDGSVTKGPDGTTYPTDQ